jgi:purine-binding chemotaxis protein CheW
MAAPAAHRTSGAIGTAVPAADEEEEGHCMSDQAAAPSANAGRTGQVSTHGSWGGDDGTTTSGDLTQFISFAIGDDHYGVDIMAVREIKGWSEITHLPKQPDYVRGVLNLRGVIVPIIDLRCRFGQGLTEATPLHVIIIVQVDQQLVGLLADRVSDIISIEPYKIKPVPKIAQSARLDFLSGIVTIDKTMIALIELTNVLRQNAAEPERHAA